MSKLRITAPGWETYTGDFGGIAFVDGASVNVLSRNQIDFLSAIVRCDLADEDGTLTGQGGIAARLVGGVDIGEAPSSLRHATQEELDADARARRIESNKPPAQIYTKEELEAIGSKEGLIGIRKIGDAWRVRDRALGKLIVLILNAQRVFVAAQVAKKDMIEVARKKATQDALDKNIARNAEIDARAKIAGTVTGTSNAIGENGENVTMPPAPPPAVVNITNIVNQTPTVVPSGLTTTGVAQLDPAVVVTQTVTETPAPDATLVTPDQD